MPQRLASVAEVPEYTTELDRIIEFPGLRCQLNERNVELLSRSRLFWVIPPAFQLQRKTNGSVLQGAAGGD